MQAKTKAPLSKFAVIRWKALGESIAQSEISPAYIFDRIKKSGSYFDGGVCIDEVFTIESRQEVIEGILKELEIQGRLFGNREIETILNMPTKGACVFLASSSSSAFDRWEGVTITEASIFFNNFPPTSAETINAFEKGESSRIKEAVERANKRRLRTYLAYLESNQDLPQEPAPAGDAPALEPEAVETKPKKRRLPAGFKVIENGTLNNDKGNHKPVEMKAENIERFAREVVPYIAGIEKRYAPGEYWKRPKNGMEGIEPGRGENALIEWEGKQYIIIYVQCDIDKKYIFRYGVKLATGTNKGTGASYFFFTGAK